MNYIRDYTSANKLWQNIVLRIGDKEYKLKHSYSDLLNIFNTNTIGETKGRQINIKNIGLVSIETCAFYNMDNKIVIKCKNIL